MAMVRTIQARGVLSCAPKMCSTPARTLLLRRLVSCCCAYTPRPDRKNPWLGKPELYESRKNPDPTSALKRLAQRESRGIAGLCAGIRVDEEAPYWPVADAQTLPGIAQIGRAHVRTPVTDVS